MPAGCIFNCINSCLNNCQFLALYSIVSTCNLRQWYFQADFKAEFLQLESHPSNGIADSPDKCGLRRKVKIEEE